MRPEQEFAKRRRGLGKSIISRRNRNIKLIGSELQGGSEKLTLIFGLYLFILSSCMSIICEGKKGPDEEGAAGYTAFLLPECNMENMNYRADKK